MRKSKYQPFTEYLQSSGREIIHMSFRDIEQIIGSKLPDCSVTYSEIFWNNSNQHYALHWLHAGYLVSEYDLLRQYVVFKKDAQGAAALIEKSGKQNTQRQTQPDSRIPSVSTYPVEKLIDASERYYSVIRNDDHGRYRSWEHCYEYFSKHRTMPSEEEQDFMCLHLAWYLASWGMLRGGSFLLQKDYRIHMPVIRLLTSPKYELLYNCPVELLCKNNTQALISELSDKIVQVYKSMTDNLGDGDGKTASDTLVTKILLGTMGCAPAYDRYFKKGLAISDVAQQRYGQKSMQQLADYYLQNKDAFETFRMKISETGIEYTPMKIMDMSFWQIGFEADLNNTP